MRKLLLGVAVMCLMTTAARADNEVVFRVEKDRTTLIDVEIWKDKDVSVTVDFEQPDGSGAALSDANVNARIEDNTTGASDDTPSVSIGGTTIELGDFGISRDSLIEGSLNDNTGIGQFNQDTGNFSNQGNVASVAVNLGAAPGEAPELADITDSQAYVDQSTVDNDSELGGNFEQFLGATPDDVDDAFIAGLDPELNAEINGSLLDNTGVFHVNQNAGSGNNQHNVLSAAIGTDAVLALADAGLSQFTSGNTVQDVNTTKFTTIDGSILNNTGIVNVNQATGSFNSQATVVNISAISSAVGLGG